MTTITIQQKNKKNKRKIKQRKDVVYNKIKKKKKLNISLEEDLIIIYGISRPNKLIIQNITKDTIKS